MLAQEVTRTVLERPEAEGPALLLIDGLNQEPEFEWIRLLQILQGDLPPLAVPVITDKARG